MGECKALLTSLGFECVASQGEAEAMCAEVNTSDKLNEIWFDWVYLLEQRFSTLGTKANN